jgi:hypothetical protein
MDEQDLKNRIVHKLLRNKVVGGHKISVQTATSSYLPSHAEGDGKTVLDELASDPDGPIERYGGGHRENIRLTSVDDAVAYLRENGGDISFGFG